jgi:hypothetical protein
MLFYRQSHYKDYLRLVLNGLILLHKIDMIHSYFFELNMLGHEQVFNTAKG